MCSGVIAGALGRHRLAVAALELEFMTGTAFWALFVAFLLATTAGVACLDVDRPSARRRTVACGAARALGFLALHKGETRTCAAMAPLSFRWLPDRAGVEPELWESCCGGVPESILGFHWRGPRG